MERILVTGGAGFIGSNLCRHLVRYYSESQVLNIDKLTYAGNLESLRDIEGDSRYRFEQVDICDLRTLQDIFVRWKPTAVMHLAAESHVDRSIDSSAEFVLTNVVGTHALLDCSVRYFRDHRAKVPHFRFLHVSTDEVFGSLGPDEFFTESTPYDPQSPYSASKASSDHLVRAWYNTFGLPILITNCGNNYGPFQFPEKFIPVVIMNALSKRAIPIYGHGDNVRDWIFVEDHIRAMLDVLKRGVLGETYVIGSRSPQTNMSIAQTICRYLDECRPDSSFRHESLISFVRDRPGHDMRYAIDPTKIESRLGWSPRESLQSGIKKTIDWYLANQNWTDVVASGEYRQRRGLEGVA